MNDQEIALLKEACRRIKGIAEGVDANTYSNPMQQVAYKTGLLRAANEVSQMLIEHLAEDIAVLKGER